MNAVKLNEARAQLRERFGASLEEDLLEECAELCKNNNISGEDFWFKWEALTYNNRGTAPRVFDKGALQAIKEGIDREAAKVKAQRTQIKKNLGGLLSRNLGGIGRAGVGVKVAPSTGLKAQTLPVKVEGSAAGPSRVRVGRGQEPISRSYRYMYEKISDRSEALDDRIDEFAEIIQKHYELPDLGDPSASTEEEVTVVGRITYDSDISSSEPVKLNEAVLALESSRAMGSGKRVPLRFDPKFRVQSTEGGVGLFPGAIVALKGRNGGGGSFVVSEVLTLPPLQTDPPDLSGQAFTACIACGPFTSDTDLEYAPWQAALKKIALENADAILLIGPFIDVTHTCFMDGNVDDTPINLFRKQFLSPLSDLLDSRPGATVILVPSIKDALSGHAVFPQNELSASLVEDTRIHLLPNPCHFTLNGVTFAASSVDVLFHLRKEEFFRIASEAHSNQGAAPQMDTMRRLCRHVVEQRSLYPILPVPQDLSQEVNLDVSHSEALKLGGDLIDSKPLSILVLPSKLKHFTKVIGDTTVINPSYISKGTYSTIKFTPANTGQSIAECLITQIIRYD